MLSEQVMMSVSNVEQGKSNILDKGCFAPKQMYEMLDN